MSIEPRQIIKIQLRQYIGPLRDTDWKVGEVRRLLENFEMQPVHKGDLLEHRVNQHFASAFANYSGEVTGRALCAYIRHNHTNYDRIMAGVNVLGVVQDVVDAARVLMNATIITEHGLSVDPLTAAFGLKCRANAKRHDRYGEDSSPEETAYRILEGLSP